MSINTKVKELYPIILTLVKIIVIQEVLLSKTIHKILSKFISMDISLIKLLFSINLHLTCTIIISNSIIPILRVCITLITHMLAIISSSKPQIYQQKQVIYLIIRTSIITKLIEIISMPIKYIVNSHFKLSKYIQQQHSLLLPLPIN